MKEKIRPALPLVALLLTASLISTPAALAAPPAITEINGQKILTLIGRDPPGVRCNNNIQIAAEVANVYKIPVQILPHALAAPGTKAPAVYFGDELIAVDGGNLNGMIDFTSLSDILELDDIPKHERGGRLTEIPTSFEQFKESIKVVQ